MIKKHFTGTLFKTYNLLHRGQLDSFYLKVKDANENMITERQYLNRYLSAWEFAPVLERNPVMDKSSLKVWINKLDDKTVHSWAYTGGSYGEPLRVPYSKTRGLIRTASLLYFNQLGGYSLGDPYALIRAKDKSSFVKFLRNEIIIVPYDVSSTQLEGMIKDLIRRRVRLLMGYPSVIYDMALFLNNNPAIRQKLSIKNIITVSEPLEDYKRKIIKETFNCDFVDRYSNEEVGIIAQQRHFSDEYIVNQYGLYVEVVDPLTLNPVPEGSQGKVLVTDIKNDLIPMIRYDTGDMATVIRYHGDQLLSISRIIGRVTEQITNPEGNPVSPLTIGPFIYKPLSKENRLVPYQFAQTGVTKYELRLKANQSDISDYLINTIMTGLNGLFGPGADVTIILVKDIECQPSGKRPVFKNETAGKKPLV
jgi:phenylacetate-CoA ligase